MLPASSLLCSPAEPHSARGDGRVIRLGRAGSFINLAAHDPRTPEDSLLNWGCNKVVGVNQCQGFREVAFISCDGPSFPAPSLACSCPCSPARCGILRTVLFLGSCFPGGPSRPTSRVPIVLQVWPPLPWPASSSLRCFLPPRLLVTSRMFAVWGKVSFDAHSFLRFYQRQERWTKCLWSQSEGKFTGKVCPKEAKPRMIHLRQWSDVHACSVQHVKERERSPAPCLAVQRRHAP